MPEMDGLTLARQLRAANAYSIVTSVGDDIPCARNAQKRRTAYIAKWGDGPRVVPAHCRPIRTCFGAGAALDQQRTRQPAWPQRIFAMT